MQETKAKQTKTSNKGITLVALVITVIVLLILAAVGIGAIAGPDGIIAKAKQAAEGYNDAAQDEAQTINELLNMIGGGNTPQEGISAEDINKNPTKYYGKEVIYSPQNGATDRWKIFYADEENIYLIATDYVESKYAPNGQATSTYDITFGTVVGNYNGVADIQNEDERVKKWINSNFTSNNNAMKATAYLLDTEVWSVFKDKNDTSSKAEYAIGGPTLEMFVASYNDTHSEKNIQLNSIEVELMGLSGYQIKWDTDSEYGTSISGLNPTESLYIIPHDERSNRWLCILVSITCRK